MSISSRPQHGHALITDAMAGNITNLVSLFAANELIFVGSNGADVFTGYSHDDTLTAAGRVNDIAARRRLATTR